MELQTCASGLDLKLHLKGYNGGTAAKLNAIGNRAFSSARESWEGKRWPCL